MQSRVYNSHYFTWMDIAFTEYWGDVVGPYGDFTDSGFDIVVAEASARFRLGARFDEDVDIQVDLVGLSQSSITTQYTVRRGDVTLTTGTVRHVCVDTGEYAKQLWPDAIRATLERRLIPPD